MADLLCPDCSEATGWRVPESDEVALVRTLRCPCCGCRWSERLASADLLATARRVETIGLCDAAPHHGAGRPPTPPIPRLGH